MRCIPVLVLAVFCHSAVLADISGVDVPAVELLFLEGRYQDVIDSAAALIAARSYRRDELYYLKGVSELEVGTFASARESFCAVVRDHPGSARVFDASVGVGDAYLLEGNVARAVASYEEALAAFPEHTNRAVLYCRLGEAYAKAGNADKSQYYFDSARLVAPLSFEVKRASAASERPAGPRIIPAAGKPSPGRIAVQVGSFRSRGNAEKCVCLLVEEGFAPYIESAAVGNGTVYRVRVGKFRTKDEARGAVVRLRSRGYAAEACADDR